MAEERARPRLMLLLGYAGLTPAVAALAAEAMAPPPWNVAAARIGGVYAALILSFLGGLWWAWASAGSRRAPPWLWIAAVAPSLGAFAAWIPPVIGIADVRGPLIAVGLMVLLSLVVDHRLVRDGWAPRWWMTLRAPLSIGLGLVTLGMAALAR